MKSKAILQEPCLVIQGLGQGPPQCSPETPESPIKVPCTPANHSVPHFPDTLHTPGMPTHATQDPGQSPSCPISTWVYEKGTDPASPISCKLVQSSAKVLSTKSIPLLPVLSPLNQR